MQEKPKWVKLYESGLPWRQAAQAWIESQRTKKNSVKPLKQSELMKMKVKKIIPRTT